MGAKYGVNDPSHAKEVNETAMNPSDLLQWHYMIFLLPFGVSTLMLLLSSVRLGHHHGGQGHVGTHGHGLHGHGAAHTAHAPSGAHGGHAQGHGHHHAAGAAHRHGSAGHKGGSDRDTAKTTRNNAAFPVGVLMGALGVGRAPWPILAQSFGIAWGFCGYWANQLFVHTPMPTLGQVAPSLGVALAGGLLGTRMSAEIFSHLLPQEETFVVSRNSLFGLTGRIAFAASDSAGRIHIYDEHGTLHDEMCRVASGHPPIEKGRNALVVDMDLQGHLIVEEVPESVH
jgi:hypothetical protein